MIMDDNMISGFITKDDDSTAPLAFQREYSIVKKVCDTSGYCKISLCRRNGRLFIAKSIKEKLMHEPMYISLLSKEYNITYELDHPNICKVYELTTIPSLGSAIVMEYIDGMTLSEFSERRLLSPDLLLKIVMETCSAMEYFHKKQILHRDIKPDNILVTNNGNNVKIIDFGFSDSDSSEMFKNPAGTKFYASPEQMRGEPLDQRSDIYSFGVMLSKLIERERFPSIYKRIVRGSVQSDKKNRFTDAGSILRLLQQYTSRNKGRSLHRTILTDIVVLLAIISLVLIFYRNPGTKLEKPDFMHKIVNTTSKNTNTKRELAISTLGPKSQIADDSNDSPITQSNSDRTKLPDNELNITKAYYSCYVNIDDYLARFTEKLRDKYRIDISQAIPTFNTDSSEASGELKKIVDKIYRAIPENESKTKSLEWAALSLQNTLRHFRELYITEFRNQIINEFREYSRNKLYSTSGEKHSSAKEWYLSTYPEIAGENLRSSGITHNELN